MKNLLTICVILLASALSYAQNVVAPSGASSSLAAQGANDVTKMYDNSTSSYYNSITVAAPINNTVDFYFVGAKSINKIEYTPRNNATGRWLNVAIWYATVDDPTSFVFDRSVTWANDNTVKTVNYPTALVKPAVVRFVVTGTSGGNTVSTCAEMKFTSAETGTNTECAIAGSLASTADTKVTPTSTVTNSQQSAAEGIDKSVDGDFATMYHSIYNHMVSSSNPAELTYNFAGNPSVDYLVYYPRQDASNNGNFGEIEVQYMLAGQSSYTTWFGYNAEFSNGASFIEFPSRLTNVISIRLRVKTGFNNNASCSEINFFTKLSPSTKITPSNASANLFNSTAENAQKTVDNNLSTLYHSTYTSVISQANPAILTYDFTGNPSLDYLVYYPRQDANNNGNFGVFDVQYKLDGETAYTTIATVNATFSKLVSVVRFPTTLKNVSSIRVVVKSGSGNFASCAEMMFYQNNSVISNDVFADNLFSALKPGTTQAQVDAISDTFFKSLANCMLNGTYNYKYRVKNFQPYKVVVNLAASFKTSTYNQYENPTGIMFSAGQEVNLFVAPNTNAKGISLKVSDMRTHNAYVNSSYSLKPGLNTINITSTGLGYIDYYTDDVNAQPVKIHIVGGLVNGLYNVSTDNKWDWVQAVNSNTAYAQIDLEGKYMNLLFDKTLLKKYNLADVAPLVNTYDTIAKIQFNMMGLSKYGIQPKNHMFAYGHNTGGLYAGGLGMHFDYSWGEANYVSVNGVLNQDIWGVAHEIGHINQLRPTFRWIGMTEVTNNIYSAYTQYTLGPTQYINARLERENANPYESDASLSGTTSSVVGGRYKGFLDRAFIRQDNYMLNNVFGKVIPFWQMQLYYQFAGALRGAPTFEQRVSGVAAAPAAGQADYAHFLGDLMQIQRGRSDAGLTDGQLMLNFVKDVCDVLKEDLTDYFVAIGMLKPINIDIVDYSTRNYTVTELQIAQTIASVKSKGYPLPVSPVLYYLSANSLNAFKNQALATGTYKVGTTLSGTTLTINHASWQNVVAYETYNTANVLLEISISGMRSAANTQTQLNYPANADWVYAISYDGSKKLVYSRSSPTLPVALISFDAALENNNVLVKWKTSAEKDNKQFELWKSTDGVKFNKIAELAGAGTKETSSNYQYTDRNFSQSAYYKLAQIDVDGNKTTYDEHIKYVKGLGATINVYPNPTTSKIYISLEGATVTTVKLTDIMGKQLKNLQIVGSQSMEVDLSGLPRGVYTLQLVSQGKTDTRKIVKQ